MIIKPGGIAGISALVSFTTLTTQVSGSVAISVHSVHQNLMASWVLIIMCICVLLPLAGWSVLGYSDDFLEADPPSTWSNIALIFG